MNSYKQNLRIKLKNIQKNLSKQVILKKSKSLSEIIINTDNYQKAKCIALFCSMEKEFDTQFLIEHALKMGKTVVVPKIFNDEMVMCIYEEPFILNHFNIIEPKNTKIVEKEAIDLMIVPYLGFDKQKNRLGYGKGFYDKYLKNSGIYTILAGISEYELDFIPKEVFDITIDKLFIV